LDDIHDSLRAGGSGRVRYRMAGFDDLDASRRQSVAVFDDDHTVADSVGQYFFYRSGHPRRRFACARRENSPYLGEPILNACDFQAIARSADVSQDRIERIGSFHPGGEYFPSVGAQLCHWNHCGTLGATKNKFQ
jgi:hypothetical protein